MPGARSSASQDLKLVAALEQLPQLSALVLAGCADITDRCLAVSPHPTPPCATPVPASLCLLLHRHCRGSRIVLPVNAISPRGALKCMRGDLSHIR